MSTGRRRRLIAISLLGVSAISAAAGKDVGIAPSDRSRFLDDSLSPAVSIHQALRGHGSPICYPIEGYHVNWPPNQRGVDPQAHLLVVDEFSRWLARILKPSLVPSAEFVAANILLVPAMACAGAEPPADVAFLRYLYSDGVHDFEVLVSQTGGGSGAMCLVICPEEGTPPILAGSPETLMTQLSSFLRVLPESLGQEAVVTTEAVAVFYFTVPIKDEWLPTPLRRLGGIPVEAYCSDRGLCLRLPKLDNEVMRYARPPSLKKWFEYRRAQQEDEASHQRYLEELEQRRSAPGASPATLDNERTQRARQFGRVSRREGVYASLDQRLAFVRQVLEDFRHAEQNAGTTDESAIRERRRDTATLILQLASEESSPEARGDLIRLSQELVRVEAPAEILETRPDGATRAKVDGLTSQILSGDEETAWRAETAIAADLSGPALRYASDKVRLASMPFEGKHRIVRALAGSRNPLLYSFYADLLQSATDDKLRRFAFDGLREIVRHARIDENGAICIDGE